MKTERGCSIKAKKESACYCMCQKEKRGLLERRRARGCYSICRETDGVCAPAVMKGGGEERVEKRRRTPTPCL